MSTHIDEWLDSIQFTCDPMEAHARFVLEYFRYPAWKQTLYMDIMSKFKLFCTYQGKKYKVLGASRLGDVWLNSNLEATSGYERRVYVDECTAWSDK